MVQRGTYPPDELHELEPPPISMIWIKLNLSFSVLMELDLVEAKLKCPKQASQSGCVSKSCFQRNVAKIQQCEMRLLPRNPNRSLLSLLPLSLNPKPLVAQRATNFYPLFFERDYMVEDSTMLFMIWKALWQAVRVPSIPCRRRV